MDGVRRAAHRQADGVRRAHRQGLHRADGGHRGVDRRREGRRVVDIRAIPAAVGQAAVEADLRAAAIRVEGREGRDLRASRVVDTLAVRPAAIRAHQPVRLAVAIPAHRAVPLAHPAAVIPVEDREGRADILAVVDLLRQDRAVDLRVGHLPAPQAVAIQELRAAVIRRAEGIRATRQAAGGGLRAGGKGVPGVVIRADRLEVGGLRVELPRDGDRQEGLREARHQVAGDLRVATRQVDIPAGLTLRRARRLMRARLPSLGRRGHFRRATR